MTDRMRNRRHSTQREIIIIKKSSWCALPAAPPGGGPGGPPSPPGRSRCPATVAAPPSRRLARSAPPARRLGELRPRGTEQMLPRVALSKTNHTGRSAHKALSEAHCAPPERAGCLLFSSASFCSRPRTATVISARAPSGPGRPVTPPPPRQAQCWFFSLRRACAQLQPDRVGGGAAREDDLSGNRFLRPSPLARPPSRLDRRATSFDVRCPSLAQCWFFSLRRGVCASAPIGTGSTRTHARGLDPPTWIHSTRGALAVTL